MPFSLTMPKLSPTMEEGTIVKWHKKEGDEIATSDVLFEVATDKATVEHEAVDEGFLRKILIGENQNAKVNQAVAICTATADESIEGFEPDGQKKKEKEPEEASSTESTEEKEAPEKAPAATGAMAQPAFAPPPPLEDYKFEWPEEEGSRLKASPLAKKLAGERGLSLEGIKGSGPGGRIVAKDLEKAGPDSMVHFKGGPQPSKKPGTFHEIALSRMRKTIGERLQSSKTFIPHFYVQQDVDAEALMRVREELKQENLKVTFNDFVVRASALALKKKPAVNSGFNSVNETITQYETIDISVAVTVDEGLITPIIRHADHKNMMQLSKEVKMLAKRAKAGQLKPEEFTGGSFTISNLGMYGIKDFQAVINPPQAAILAVGGITSQPVVKGERVVPGHVMHLSLAADHRVVDGALAAEFINEVKYFLEHPSLLVL